MNGTALPFLLAAAALMLVVLAILVWPLLRPPRTTAGTDPRQANLDVLRDQMRELEREREDGSLVESDFTQAREELQRRLLDETAMPAQDSSQVSSGSDRRTALVLLFALPIMAIGGYAWLGNPQALDPLNTQPRMETQEMNAMLQRLADRLKANPDDTQGWIMLARSSKALGRYTDAARAFASAGKAIDNEPVLLAEYAEVLAQMHDGSFDGKPDELIARALAIGPDEPQVLYIAGTAAALRKDYAAVVDFWGRLVPQLEPGSEEARSLEEAVNRAREIIGQRPLRQ